MQNFTHITQAHTTGPNLPAGGYLRLSYMHLSTVVTFNSEKFLKNDSTTNDIKGVPIT